MPAPDVIGPFYASGILSGITVGGYIYIASNQGGIVMQDTAGKTWLLVIGTDGRLSSQLVTF